MWTQIASPLSYHGSLQWLAVRDMDLASLGGDAAVAEILAKTRTLHTLDLAMNRLGEASFRLLGAAIAESATTSPVPARREVKEKVFENAKRRSTSRVRGATSLVTVLFWASRFGTEHPDLGNYLGLATT